VSASAQSPHTAGWLGRGGLSICRLSAGSCPKLRVVEILFHDSNRVKLVVEMSDPDCYTTKQAPHIPRLLFKLFPHLARHRCENDNGYTFKQECESTEIPHLLEHLIIELQGQARGCGTLKGETQWNWRVDPKGRFNVFVEYDNEMLVMGAIRAAERIIEALDNHSIEGIDVDAEIDRLRKLAIIGEEVKNGHAISESIEDAINAAGA
jgi:hypothetical protein